MKNLTLCLMTLFLLFVFIPGKTLAGNEAMSSSVSVAKSKAAAEAKVLVSRLEIIKEMDKSNLSSSEKKELRKEVRSIKKQLKEKAGGIYLSVGAIILIVILLVILL